RAKRFRSKIALHLEALIDKSILTSHAPRFLRSPPSAHRVLAAGWSAADEGADEKSGGIQDAGHRHYRPWQPAWRDRILSGSAERRDQTDHWLRSLHRPRRAYRPLQFARVG